MKGLGCCSWVQMMKIRVKSEADHQPAASHSRNSHARPNAVSLTLGENSPAQVKRLDSLQANPAQLALKQKSETMQPKRESSMNCQPEASLQRVEEEELQGKFETAQRMEEEELQGKFDTAQRAEGLEEEELQGKFETAQRFEDEEELQGKFDTAQRVEEEDLLQGKANDTGMPDNLKAGMESLSGVSLDHVQVHYNSAKPAQLNAHAYAQGSQIHLGPGQEQHLPHEAWHLVQQKQGRVKPTTETSDGTKINDDPGLETEADVMGAKAAQLMSATRSGKSKS